MAHTPKKKNLTVRYAFIQGFFWMNFAAILGFSSIYLLGRGFTNTEIGLLIAVAGAVSAILQPVVAGYADRPSSPSLKRIVIALDVILLGLSVLLLLFPGQMILTGLFYGGSITFLQLLTPLVNSLGMESINQGKVLNFGVSRGMGSVAYAIASYALGLIVAKLGLVTVPVSMILTFGAFLIALLLFPFTKPRTAAGAARQKKSGGLLYFIKKYKRFSVVLLGCVFVYISHVLLNNFTYQIVESKGGGSSEMGVAMALSALIELPTLFFFGYMLKKLRADIWFRISGIFFMLKSLGTLLVRSIPAFYAVQIFQMLGWALITVSSVYYVNSIMEEQDAIKGQAYMTMTYTLGSVLGALTGGALIDKAGVKTMLAFGTGAAFLGMVIILAAARPADKKNHN